MSKAENLEGQKSPIPPDSNNFLVIAANNQGLRPEDIRLLETPFRKIKDPLLKGRRSELRVKVLLTNLDSLKKVTWSTQKEDRIEKIDLWAWYYLSPYVIQIPIQVKSSDTSLDSFLESDKIQTNKIIALNAGDTQSNLDIIDAFKAQLSELYGF
jgi:hypothetical protein